MYCAFLDRLRHGAWLMPCAGLLTDVTALCCAICAACLVCRASCRPQVQRYVQLCRVSGGTLRFRWNEQGVQAMVWQLFVGSHDFMKFNFSYLHRGDGDEVHRRVYGVPLATKQAGKAKAT